MRTERHEETNNRFSHFCERPQNYNIEMLSGHLQIRTVASSPVGPFKHELQLNMSRRQQLHCSPVSSTGSGDRHYVSSYTAAQCPVNS